MNELAPVKEEDEAPQTRIAGHSAPVGAHARGGRECAVVQEAEQPHQHLVRDHMAPPIQTLQHTRLNKVGQFKRGKEERGEHISST